MEVFLNLAWTVLAVALVLLWLHLGCRVDQGRYSQIIAIAVLIAILFPVISVSDDLMAVQNPSETDNCQRRDHLVLGDVHLLQPAVVEPFPVLTEVIIQYVSPRELALGVDLRRAPIAIANRPPPTA